MNIFESLENLPVSESCFEDIISIVENIVDSARKKEGMDKYSDAGPTLSSLLRARDTHKNLLAQAKSIRRHYKNRPYNNDVDYDKLDHNVNHEKEAVDSLNNLTSDGRMQETDVKDILTRDAEHKKKEQLERKEKDLRRREEYKEKGLPYKRLDSTEKAFLKQRNEEKQKKPSLTSRALKVFKQGQKELEKAAVIRKVRNQMEALKNRENNK